ncbi:hypothetical protein [Erythrobacter sp. HI0019]|nr:hypothetical protein [Erythrobacter sp. HI0019]
MLLVEEFGPDVSQTILIARLGGSKAARKRKLRIAELCGSSKALPGLQRKGELSELLDVLPGELHDDLARALRETKLPAIVAPSGSHIGQILALQDAQVRVLAALALLSSCIQRRSYSHRDRIITSVKRLDRILEGASSAGGRNSRWAAYLAGKSIPEDPSRIRDEFPDRFRWLRSRAVELGPMIGRKLQTEFPGLILGLSSPASNTAPTNNEVPSESDLPSFDVDPQVARRLRLLRLAPFVVRQVRWRIAELDEVIRTFEYPGLTTKQYNAAGRLDDHIERPLAGFFNREMFFQIDSQALHRSLVDANFTDWGGWVPRAPATQKYLCISQEAQPDDVWFGDIVRTRAFAPKPLGLDSLDVLRLQILSAGALPDGRLAPSGLLDFTGADRVLARYAPRIGLAMVPIVEFYHAMLMAALIIIYALRFGPRIGETMQIRLGRDCMTFEKRGRSKAHVLRLIPKGQHQPAIFELDDEIRDLINRIAKLAHARWFPDLRRHGKLDLPELPYGNPSRKNIPPGRFILRNETHALKAGDLGWFVRILLHGVVDMKSHDGRFILATIMSVLGYDVDETGHALHHAPGSRQAKIYDLSKHLSEQELAGLRRELKSAGIVGRLS